MLKKIIKYTALLLVCFAAGFLGTLAIVCLATDRTFGGMLEKIGTEGPGEMLLSVLVSLTALVLATVAQIILHEAGHLIGGLLTGYRFVSFRIFRFVVLRDDTGHLRLKRFHLAGTGGQCLLTPPPDTDRPTPYVLYNAGGFAANFLTALIALTLMVFVDGLPAFATVFLLMNVIVGIALGLMNAIPMKAGGVSNDGYNLRLLKDPRLLRSMVIQLRVNAAVQNGMRPTEMPAEWFQSTGMTHYDNLIEVGDLMLRTAYQMDLGHMEVAQALLEGAYEHPDQIGPLMKNEVACELLYLYWATGQAERAAALLTPELEKYIRSTAGVMSSKQRILFAQALCGEKDTARALEIFRRLEASQDKYLMQGEVKMDLALMRQLL